MKTIMHGNQKIVINTTGEFTACITDRKGNVTTLEISLNGVVSERAGATLVPHQKAVAKVLSEFDKLVVK